MPSTPDEPPAPDDGPDADHRRPPEPPAPEPPYGAPAEQYAYPVPPPGAPGVPPDPLPSSRPRSFGAGLGAGVGIGCGAYLLGGILALGTLGVIGNIFGLLWPFLIILVVGIGLMFSARTRPQGTGILIVTAAAWIIVLGPCVALLGGFA